MRLTVLISLLAPAVALATPTVFGNLLEVDGGVQSDNSDGVVGFQCSFVGSSCIGVGPGATQRLGSDGGTPFFTGPLAITTDPAINSASGTNDSSVIGLANLTRRAMPGFVNFKRVATYSIASSTAAAFTATSAAAPTSTCVSGTAAADAATDPTQQLVSITTQASTNATCNLTSPLSAPGIGRWTHLPKFSAVIFTGSSLATERVWAGMTISDLTGSDTGTQRKAAFRFSTGAADTTWQACTSDGTTASCTDTGVTVTVSTSYTLEIDCATASTCFFYVNNALTPQVSKTTNLPNASNTDMGWQIGVTTLANVGSMIEIAKMALFQN